MPITKRRFATTLATLIVSLSVASCLAGEVSSAPQTFETDIQPLLTRYGCNAGKCHGKSRGQNGFALSLLGFDAEFDYAALIYNARGRRVSQTSPEQSLLLSKATGALPHGGGQRFEVGSKPYEQIRSWIAAGAPETPKDAPQLLRIAMTPNRQSLAANESFSIAVVAEYSDGGTRDVTEYCAFRSNDNTVADVSQNGRVTAGALPGETQIMARYMNNIAVCTATIPVPGKPNQEYFKLSADNRIDALVTEKLDTLGIAPSWPANDATFHRRAYLRAIGRLPTPKETRKFLSDQSVDKRNSLIDHLLEQPEYADFWANKWADLLRPNPYRVGIKAVWTLDSWLRDAFRKNMPYDQFVSELVTAKGSTWKNGATVIFRDRPSTVEIGSSVSQLFLGVRLDCAKCHHHPFEVWSQDDFYGFAAFFARVGHNGRISPPISGSEELIYTKDKGQLKHGRTGKYVLPKTLTGESVKVPPGDDPREALVTWMLSPENPYFAHVMANRVWAEILGRGIVDPIDDIRLTNPATNQPLLDYLAEDFRQHDFDIKHLIRTIMKSQTFGLSTAPNDRNKADRVAFSRYYRQRLRAEVLIDAVADVTDTTEKFDAVPPGSRATQIWTHRTASQFLDTFGRPDPNQDPPCERMSDSTTPQILHLMNSPKLNEKLAADNALPAKLATSKRTNAELVEECYLRLYCRFPTEHERQKALAILPAKDRRPAVEDLFWALINGPEFLFID